MKIEMSVGRSGSHPADRFLSTRRTDENKEKVSFHRTCRTRGGRRAGRGLGITHQREKHRVGSS